MHATNDRFMTSGSGVLPKATMLVLAALLLGASPSRGQLPTATAASLGMADNYTAVARGFSAISLGPRILRVEQGSHMLPITHADLLADRISAFVRGG